VKGLQRMLKAMVTIYIESLKFNKQFQANNHYFFFTPVLFIRSLHNYKRLINDRVANVFSMQTKYQKAIT
jgi:hypothetical protein